MTYPSRRPLCLSAAAFVVLAAAGCSSTDAAASITVPSPPAEQSALCSALHKELPESVAGQDREDPGPESELTAGWGDGAIVLRCGVPRPERMSDPQAQGLEVDGVDWLVEERDAGPRFTTTYRKAYVEVTLSTKYAHDAGPLTDLAESVAKTIPSSL
ncbi:DUF3515 domain-containing protein [Streptomyces sp. NPDC051907]|uniref:DUF3515 domain-containing protein n=1 Tax=Streptomyces sp. NPDC051907 TaxID=3155284 RepID=UPI00341657AD